MAKKPKCPYCGDRMELMIVSPECINGTSTAWYQCVACESSSPSSECPANSPRKEIIKKALALALRRAEPEWISVKDRPPEEAEPVNVTWVNHCPAPYYSKIKNVEQTATAVYFGGKWYWYSAVCVDMLEEYGRNDVDLLDENIEITHWMPLPKTPKEGER